MAEKSRSCGCSSLLLLVVGLAAAVLVGRLAFTGLEVMALAFTRFGVADPVVGWGLTGGVLGALVGGIVGLRRAGRRHQLVEFGLALLVVAGLAFLGARAADGYVRAGSTTPLFTVVVEPEDLNVRPAPTTAGDPVTTVPRGTRLDVIGSSDGWYEVAFERDGVRYRGWVSGDHVAQVDEATYEGEEPATEPIPLGDLAGDPPPEAVERSPDAPREGTLGRIYEAGAIDVPPRPLSTMPRVDSGPAGYDGTVHLGVVIGADGSVEDVSCLDRSRVGPSGCRTAARAAYRMGFQPGREGARNVRARASLAVLLRPSPGSTPPPSPPRAEAPTVRPSTPRPSTTAPPSSSGAGTPRSSGEPAPNPERASAGPGSSSVSIAGLGSRGASCPRPAYPGVSGTATYTVTFAPDGRYVSSRPLLRGGDARIDQAVRSVVSGCRTQALPAWAPQENWEGRVTFRFTR